MSKNRVFIYGSCVSRDTFEHLDPEQFELVQYVARQSALSAYTRPVTLVEPPRLESPFQQRMVAGDYASSLQTLIPEAAASTDLILIDLVDERLGAYVLPDGSVVTRSTELVQSGAEQQLPAGSQHLPFGSEQHFQYWSQGIGAVGELIRHHMPRAAVVLLDLPWAERSEAGSPTPDSFGVSAAEANPTFRAYAQVAAQALGAEVISLRPEEVASSPDHPWGDAPFHYAEDVYLRVVKELTGTPGRSIWRSHTPQPSEHQLKARRKSAGSEHVKTVHSTNEKIVGGPNFLILGAQRAATAWLENHLGKQPDVFIPPTSHGSILTERKRAADPRTREEYVKLFLDAGNHRFRGQRSVLYFWADTNSAFDTKRENPALLARDFLPNDTRFVVSLRNPVSRAISAYWHSVALGKVSPRTSIFQAANQRGLFSVGQYARHYKAWADSVGAERITVLLYDDLMTDPYAFLSQAFLAIGASGAPDAVPGLERSVNRNVAASALRQAAPHSAAELQVLVEFYRSDISFVEHLLGRDLSHWSDVEQLRESGL